MEEFEKFKSVVKSERHRIFRWMCDSLELHTKFMVPREEEPNELGHDGSINAGLESLLEVIKNDNRFTAH